MKFILPVALVMAVTGAAWAETVPAFPSTGDMWNSFRAVHFYSRNRDQSTGYVASVDGTYTRATPTSPWVGPGTLTELKDPAAQDLLQRTGDGGGMESQWGIFGIYTLEAGSIIAGDIFKKIPNEITYDWSGLNVMTGDTALVGVFYDGWDASVTLNGTSLITQTKNIQFQLWAVDKSAVNLEGGSQGPHYDPNWRTAQDRYKTWVDGSGTLLLTGSSTYQRFIGTELGTAPLAFDGETVVYFDIDKNGPGLWDFVIGGNSFYTDPAGNQADMKITYDIDPGQNDWTVNSHDDGGTLFFVPEPLTMLGLAMSSLGIGGYMRRRMRNR